MLSLRRATPRHRRCTAFRTYFYPRPPCGERLTNKRLDERERNFYPRSPCGERRPVGHTQPRCAHFYPRSPCGERRKIADAVALEAQFLSTLSLRRTTPHPQPTEARHRHFYPRSPCGERLRRVLELRQALGISIHALLAESDRPIDVPQYHILISIHALLAESDCYSLRHSTQSRYFYPRSPCGERLYLTNYHFTLLFIFLSTLSLRRATSLGLLGWLRVLISIHALLAESDS